MIGPMSHKLKTWPEFFGPVARGVKTFELRRNDRRFRVGDTLILREWDPEEEEYTGAEVTRTVTYVLELGNPPFDSHLLGWVALGLKP